MTDKPRAASAPVVLELASLPRDQAGPFLLLGVPKNASKQQIEEHWAKRVIWARKKQIKSPLEDINWAREVLNDPDRRMTADAASLNIDTQEGYLKQLESGGTGRQTGSIGWQPLDEEKALASYAPEVDFPNPDEIRHAITVPEVPRTFPAVRQLLEQLANEPLDPWQFHLEAPERTTD